jgi:hypothetical protein
MTRNELLSILPKGLIWAELGVFEGEFSKKIFELAKPKELHLIDIFPSSMISGDKDGKNIKTLDLTNIPNVLAEYFKNKNVFIHKCTTVDFLENAKKISMPIDAVYIDADHSYNAVMLDLDKSYDILPKNGYICGHDYNEKIFPEVFQAVNDFCTKNSLNIQVKTDDLLPSFLIKL